MLTPRPSEARGAANHGWLDTRHTFSFAQYYDPAHMGFRSLRVINEDIILPGAGFPTHGHRDMEVITYPISGAIAHHDNTGAASVIRPGQVQRMTAGRGIRHSEYNASVHEPAHFLQIWILPDRLGLEPGYEQKDFRPVPGRPLLLAAPEGADNALALHQDARLYALLLDEGREVVHPLAPGRGAWVQLARGEVEINGSLLRAGDGAALEEEPQIRMIGVKAAELLLFDLR